MCFCVTWFMNVKADNRQCYPLSWTPHPTPPPLRHLGSSSREWTAASDQQKQRLRETKMISQGKWDILKTISSTVGLGDWGTPVFTKMDEFLENFQISHKSSGRTICWASTCWMEVRRSPRGWAGSEKPWSPEKILLMLFCADKERWRWHRANSRLLVQE